MELLVPEITAFSILIPTILGGLLIGLFFGVGTDDIAGFIAGGIVGAIVILLVSFTIADGGRQDEVTNAFEKSYNVILLDGTIPIGAQKSEVVELFTTQTDGSAACTVSTTAEKYKVVCDGEELRPVKN